MSESTKPSENSAENGNKSKPMLANRLLKFRFWGNFGELNEEEDVCEMEMLYGEKFCFFESEPINDLFACRNFKVMQFTGFKDFDGKEIYEGDILEYVSYMRDENKRKEIVEFDEKCGGWYVHKQADTLADVLFKQHNEEWQRKQNYKPSTKHKVRIIGNIYENQKLLQTTS